MDTATETVALQEQLVHAHAAAQAQREMDILSVTARQEQLTQAHVEAQQQRAMEQLRQFGKQGQAVFAREQAEAQRTAQERYDISMREATEEKARLEKERTDADHIHELKLSQLRIATGSIEVQKQQSLVKEGIISVLDSSLDPVRKVDLSALQKSYAQAFVEDLLHDPQIPSYHKPSSVDDDREDKDDFHIRSPTSTLKSPVEKTQSQIPRSLHHSSPRKQSTRTGELLSDAQKILQLSQLKKKKNISEDYDDEPDSDVNILPVFSAWCDDVLLELNSDDHIDRTRKLTRGSNHGRKFSGSPVNQSKNLSWLK